MEGLKNIYRQFRNAYRKKKRAWFGSKDYKKFVIISRSRTGSTLLMALLRAHPNVVCEGEIFKVLNGRSCRSIWDEFFGKRERIIRQVGFKLFYYHPFDDDKAVWDFIQDDPKVSILHLKRSNLLRALVSQKIGEKTKQWTQNIKDDRVLDKQIRIEEDECRQTFEQVSQYEQQTKERFEDSHPYMELGYEDLSASRDATMREVFDFLDLPYYSSKTVMKKQNPEQMTDLLINYNELKQAFNSTKWAYLFKE